MRVFILFLLLVGLMAKNAQAHVRMGIISDSNYCGEREVGWRIKIAAESLGWEVFLDEQHGRKLRKMDNLDWVICLLPENKYENKKCPNYLTVFHPFNYLDEHKKLLPFYEKYDGYLLTINPTEQFATSFKSKKKDFFFVPFYPTVQEIPYKRVSLNHLTTMIPVWSNRLTDEKYIKLFSSLSRDDFVKFYGIHKNAHIIQRGYMGSLPFDGVSIINTLQTHGIELIIHSDIHNQEGIPSSRIFEAAAASVVIICDENAFVKKHFGESVFYIDTSLPSDEIYTQIKNHVNTIMNNPENALKMAKKAHQIFLDKFLMTHQLLQLESMHNRMKALKTTFFANLFSWIKKTFFFLSAGWHTATHALTDPIPLTVLPNADHQYSLINSIDFHPHDNIFCAAYTHNDKISFYKIDENRCITTVQILRNPHAQLSLPQHAVFSPDGNKLVVANWHNQTLNVYLRKDSTDFCETPAAVITPPKTLEQCKPHGIAFSPCGNYFTVAYGAADYVDYGIALFKAQDTHLECIDIIKNTNLPGIPKGITFTPDGTHLLVTFCNINSLGLFRVKDHKIDPLPAQIIHGENSGIFRPEDVKITPDGRFCAVSNSAQHTVTFYPFDKKSNVILQSTPHFTLHNPESRLRFPHGLAFSQDGSYFAITQFGPVQVTADGDLVWSYQMQPSEATVNLYLMTK